MIRINTSHEIRGAKIHQYISIPEPTVANLTAVLKNIAWVAGRAVPEIEIIES